MSSSGTDLHEHKIYLNVPYSEKDEAKSLGAKWDPTIKKWYALGTLERCSRFRYWLPTNALDRPGGDGVFPRDSSSMASASASPTFSNSPISAQKTDYLKLSPSTPTILSPNFSSAASECTRTYLNVPYNQKDEAKKCGARWDPDKRQWFVMTDPDVLLDSQSNYIQWCSWLWSPTRRPMPCKNRQSASWTPSMDTDFENEVEGTMSTEKRYPVESLEDSDDEQGPIAQGDLSAIKLESRRTRFSTTTTTKTRKSSYSPSNDLADFIVDDTEDGLDSELESESSFEIGTLSNSSATAKAVVQGSSRHPGRSTITTSVLHYYKNELQSSDEEYDIQTASARRSADTHDSTYPSPTKPNHLFCVACNEMYHKDSFSAVQRREVEDYRRFCLRHSSYAGTYREPKRVKPLSDSDTSDRDEDRTRIINKSKHASSNSCSSPIHRRVIDDDSIITSGNISSSAVLESPPTSQCIGNLDCARITNNSSTHDDGLHVRPIGNDVIDLTDDIVESSQIKRRHICMSDDEENDFG